MTYGYRVLRMMPKIQSIDEIINSVNSLFEFKKIKNICPTETLKKSLTDQNSIYQWFPQPITYKNHREKFLKT